MSRIREQMKESYRFETFSGNQWGPPGYETSPTPYTITYNVHERCTDEVHARPYETGGPLSVHRIGFDSVQPSPHVWLRNGYLEFKGRLWASRNAVHNFNPDLVDFVDPIPAGYLDTLGPQAWNKFKPGKPGVDLGQTLGELRELPRLTQVKVLNFKNRGYHGRDFGSDALNLQFGWLPVIRDIQGIYRTYKTLEKRLEQLKRDNGRRIRRRGPLRERVETLEALNLVDTGYGYLSPSLTTGFYNVIPHIYRGQRMIEKSWFSGRFRYWIPDVESIRWRHDTIRKLFGLQLTPALAWELMPWSWLIDWFGNIGDVLNNLSENAAENLTADYAYIMSTHRYAIDYRVQSWMRQWDGVSILIDTGHSFSHVSKQRVVAHPFGFGLTDADLNVRQLGILAALGLTKT